MIAWRLKQRRTVKETSNSEVLLNLFNIPSKRVMLRAAKDWCLRKKSCVSLLSVNIIIKLLSSHPLFSEQKWNRDWPKGQYKRGTPRRNLCLPYKENHVLFSCAHVKWPAPVRQIKHDILIRSTCCKQESYTRIFNLHKFILFSETPSSRWDVFYVALC